MIWAMLLAYSSFAACCAAQSSPDRDVYDENSASPYAHVEQTVDSHFQLGSGAGSVSQPHGNENNEPAVSLGHPRSLTHTSAPRESRIAEVTARNLQVMQLQSISGLFSKFMNLLARYGTALFYATFWPISVMLLCIYIYMVPRVGDRSGRSRGDQPPRFDPANNLYSFRAWIQEVSRWVSQTHRPVQSQAFAIISSLDGDARHVAGQTSIEEIMQGGYVDGLHCDPVTYLLLTLAQRYGQREDQPELDSEQDQLLPATAGDGGNRASVDPPQRAICTICLCDLRNCMCVEADVNWWWERYQRENPGDTDFTREEIVELRRWIQEPLAAPEAQERVTDPDPWRILALAAVNPPRCLPRYPDRVCQLNPHLWRGSLDLEGNDMVNEWCFTSRMPGLPVQASPAQVLRRNLIEYCSLLQTGQLCALDVNHLQLGAWFREAGPERVQYPNHSDVSTLSSCFPENTVYPVDMKCDVLSRHGFRPYEGPSREFDTIVHVELFGRSLLRSGRRNRNDDLRRQLRAPETHETGPEPVPEQPEESQGPSGVTSENALHFVGPVLTFTTLDGQPMDLSEENSSGLRLNDTQGAIRSRSRTPPRSESADSSCTIPWGDEELMRAESIRQKRLACDAAQAALDSALSKDSVPSSLTDLYQHAYGVSDSIGSNGPDSTLALGRRQQPASPGLSLQFPSLELPRLNLESRSTKQQKTTSSESVCSKVTVSEPQLPPGPRWRWVDGDQPSRGEWQITLGTLPCTPTAGQLQSPLRQPGPVESYSLSPTSTPRVASSDCQVAVTDPKAFPLTAATEDDAKALAEDWNSGRNRFSISDASRISAEPQLKVQPILKVEVDEKAKGSGISTTVQRVYHGATRLAGKLQGPVVDPGSIYNLSGDRWAKEMYRIAEANGREAAQKKRDKPLQVAGVGHGTQGAKYDVNIPVALKTAAGDFKDGNFDAPCIADSDIPGLLGLRSLEENRSLLDTVNSKLYFLGPGDYDLMAMLPPGTECYDLQKSTSGHLILPMTHYEELDVVKKATKDFAEEVPRTLHADEVATAATVAPPPGLSLVDEVATAVPVAPPPGLSPVPAGAAAAARPPSPTTNELLAALPDACAEMLSHLDADQIDRLAAAFGRRATEEILSSPSEAD